MARRPLRFGLALGAVFLAVTLVELGNEDTLHRERSFFGTYRVLSSDGGSLHELMSGTTLHGAERVAPGPPAPISYYGRTGPVGQAFEALPRETVADAATIGLGAGTLGCYAPPGGRFTYYEIDETVVRIARDRRLFTFVSDCRVRPRIVLGDGRRSLEREPRGGLGLVVVDAFNSDAIPVHLITREAVRLYLSRTRPGGALMFHLSNRYLDLEPVLGNIARELRLDCRIQDHAPSAAERARGFDDGTWALLGRDRRDLGTVSVDLRWRDCRDDRSARTWSDDYSNPLAVVDWG